MVAMADEMIAAKYIKLEELERALIKERCDVERLEGFTVERFFHFLIIGTGTERLEKEQREYLIAQSNYEEHLASIKALEEDRDRFLFEIGELQNVDQVYVEILEEKASLLKESKSPLARKIFDLCEEFSDREAEILNIEETIVAAGDALAEFESLASKLESVLMSFKFDKVESIAESVRLAQKKLQLFEVAIVSLAVHDMRIVSRYLLFTFSNDLVDLLTPETFTPKHLLIAAELAEDKIAELQSAIVELEAALYDARRKGELALKEWRAALEAAEEL